jgi:hypothetical protein
LRRIDEVNVLDLEELAQRQAAVVQCIRDAAPLLGWLATQVCERDRIPQNAWRQANRPLPKESKTLSLAFDVWHAMIRAERALRLSSPEEAKNLRRDAAKLRDFLEKYTGRRTRGETDGEYARRLVSDEIYGTFNVLSAASVLRSEVFVERSKSTPSYLAGHIVVAGLKVARNQARAHSVQGIREHPPRLYPVAQGAHSLMLYVEHLRRRASLFDAIATEISEINRFGRLVGTARGKPKQLPILWNGYLRMAMTRLASNCEDCASLLLSTRAFFGHWRLAIQERLEDSTPIALPDLEISLKSAIRELEKSNPGEIQKKQRLVFERSAKFCSDLALSTSNVSHSLDDLLKFTGKRSFTELMARVDKLRDHLKELETIHLAGAPKGEYPSIRDAVRFQFAKMLVREFVDEKGTPLGATETLRHRLEKLLRTYGLQVEEAPSVEVFACNAIRLIGESPVGRGLLDWWQNCADCFDCPSLETYKNREPHEYLSESFVWLSSRHASFEAIAKLTRSIAKCPNSTELRGPLLEAASTERLIADQVERAVKELTQWCSSRGHQLVLAGQNEMSLAADPTELVAALSIADRIGEPWNERLEVDAFNVISALQRSDGSFGAVVPLCQNRGFLYYLPSSSTLALLARFVTRGPAAPDTPETRRRLLQWAPVLLKGAKFLTDTMVQARHITQKSRGEWSGWHSDRHPEAERIDSFATTEALTALCRLDDAIRWLINLSAAEGFGVTWPKLGWGRAVPIDCESKDHLLSRIAPLIARLKATSQLHFRVDQAGDTSAGQIFLFYGPPGTGKTYSQGIIAGELGWPIVTLTIGDFLSAGEDRLVSRTAEIFRRLSYLSQVCIVFDEFDEMVVGRPRRGDQGWAGSRLTTAAMLPLLSNLRDHAKGHCCSVSFTTNLIENIDRAATRGGRVDETLLMSYPDYSSRLLFGVLALDRLRQERGAGQEAKQLDWGQMHKLAVDTALCSQTDVRRYIEDTLRSLHPHKPRSPIDSTYYGNLSEPRPDSIDAIRRLLGSVGEPDVIGEWLTQNPEWREAYEQTNPPERLERRRTWRHQFSVMENPSDAPDCSIDDLPGRLADVGEEGFCALLSQPPDRESFKLHIKLGPTNRRPERRVAINAKKLDQSWVGSGLLLRCKIMQSDAAVWRKVVNEMISPRRIAEPPIEAAGV